MSRQDDYDRVTALEEQLLQDAIVIEHQGVMKTSPKAKFFITGATEDGEVTGTWIPKSGIIKESDTEVVVEDWCKINTIIWS